MESAADSTNKRMRTLRHSAPLVRTLRRSAPLVWLHGVAPLLAGIALYVLFRGANLVALRWLSPLHLGGPLAHARALVAPLRPLLPHWVLYNLPDALWGYTVGAALSLMWRGGTAPRSRAAWLAGGLLVVCMFEVGQSLGVVPGTFDWVDLFASSVGYAAGAFFVSRRSASRSAGECIPLGGRATFTGEDT